MCSVKYYYFQIVTKCKAWMKKQSMQKWCMIENRFIIKHYYVEWSYNSKKIEDKVRKSEIVNKLLKLKKESVGWKKKLNIKSFREIPSAWWRPMGILQTGHSSPSFKDG